MTDRRWNRGALAAAAMIAGMACLPPAALAEPVKEKAGAALDRGAANKPLTAAPSRYCENVADAAADTRYQLQKDALSKMEREIEGRIKVLEAKRAEYETWLKRRSEFLAGTDEKVVLIYARMRPAAAAVQLATMEDEVAAAILAKLNARVSSAIFNEMEPARAAQLANVITDAPRRTPVKSNEKL